MNNSFIFKVMHHAERARKRSEELLWMLCWVLATSAQILTLRIIRAIKLPASKKEKGQQKKKGPSLISLMVSVDVKQYVYLLTRKKVKGSWPGTHTQYTWLHFKFLCLSLDTVCDTTAWSTPYSSSPPPPPPPPSGNVGDNTLTKKEI